jgi:hypothetical protein
MGTEEIHFPISRYVRQWIWFDSAHGFSRLWTSARLPALGETVPAVQRLAILAASPTLPLAASLGLTFSYNVTIGIPVYIEIAKAVMKYWPA